MGLENTAKFALPVLALAGCLLSSADGYADGDDYFAIANVPLDHQLIYTGAVKDEDGNYLEGVLVRWQATGSTGPEGEEHTSTAGTWTDVLGRFRTLDIARVVAREGAELDPMRVEVSAEKPGYEIARRLRRTLGREFMGLQQVDFVMRKVARDEAQQE
ncbi:MAG: hypothetical protein KDE14_12730 [Rhodobacteraceae bacterium]|nr:hypothetical protein [Paracoccaceae bacterium]